MLHEMQNKFRKRFNNCESRPTGILQKHQDIFFLEFELLLKTKKQNKKSSLIRKVNLY